jgi:hypothetical protein
VAAGCGEKDSYGGLCHRFLVPPASWDNSKNRSKPEILPGEPGRTNIADHQQHCMDKRRKTRWERKMRMLAMSLVILVPILFGIVFWLIAKFAVGGP